MEFTIKIQKTIALDEQQSKNKNKNTINLTLNHQIKNGISNHDLSLTLSPKQLEDGLTLDGLTINQGSTLQLLISPTPTHIKLSITSVFRKTLTLEQVEASHTIENIKTMIHNETGIFTHLQSLFFEGKPLENNLTLAHYDIYKEATLLLDVKLEIQIFVKTLAGECMTFEVKRSDTVYRVKEEIHRREGFPAEFQGLFFAGKELGNEETLAFHNIENQTTVMLIYRLRSFFQSSPREKRLYDLER